MNAPFLLSLERAFWHELEHGLNMLPIPSEQVLTTESLRCFLSSRDSIRVLYLVEFLIPALRYLYVGIRKLGETND